MSRLVTNFVTPWKYRIATDTHTTSEYIDELKKLQSTIRVHQQLVIAVTDLEHALKQDPSGRLESTKQCINAVRAFKLQQMLRCWYIEADAHAITLDFDHVSFDAIVLEWKLLCSNVPAIISTTSTDGVHVIVPSKPYPRHQMPLAAELFCKLYSLPEYDVKAAGGCNKGFFDPTRITQPIQLYINREDYRYKIGELELPEPTKKELKVQQHLQKQEDQKPGSADAAIAEYQPKNSTVTTILRSWWSQHQNEVIDQHRNLLECKDFKDIVHVPDTVIKFGTVFSYVTRQGKRFYSICYISGKVTFVPWSTNLSAPEPEVLPGMADRVQSYLYYSLRSIQLRRCTVRWYDLDGKWVRIDRVITALTGVLLSGDFDKKVRKDFRIHVAKWINGQNPGKNHTYIPSSIVDWMNNVDEKKIWHQFGTPDTLVENIYVVETIKEKPQLLDLGGGVVNGCKLGPINWKYLDEYSVGPWVLERCGNVIASWGYAATWSWNKLRKKLQELPETIQVTLPVQIGKKQSDYDTWQRKMVCTRQIIHAAALRGCNVIVHVNLKQHPNFYSFFHITKSTSRSSVKTLVSRFFKVVPEPIKLGSMHGNLLELPLKQSMKRKVG